MIPAINVFYPQEECIVGLDEIPSEPILVGDFNHDSEHQLLLPGESNSRWRQLNKHEYVPIPSYH